MQYIIRKIKINRSLYIKLNNYFIIQYINICILQRWTTA